MTTLEEKSLMSLVQFPRLSRREEQEFTGSISGTEWQRGAGAYRFDSRHQTNTFFSLSPSHRSPSALFFFLPGLPTTLRGLCRGERFTTIVERWLSISLVSISELQSSFWLSYVSHLVKPSRHAKRMIAVKRQDIKNLTILVAVRGVTTSSAMRQRSESRMVPIYQLCRWRNAYHKSRRKSLWNPASNMAENPDWHTSASFHQGCSGDSHGMRQHQ